MSKDFHWAYESDFVNIDVDKDTEDGEPMVNIYFNFPVSLNLTKSQAEDLQKALTTALSKIRPQELSETPKIS